MQREMPFSRDVRQPDSSMPVMSRLAGAKQARSMNVEQLTKVFCSHLCEYSGIS